MGYPKNIEAEEKWALKKEELEKKIRKNNSYEWIRLIKLNPLSIWIFIVPFIAVNTCLILITQFHEIIS